MLIAKSPLNFVLFLTSFYHGMLYLKIQNLREKIKIFFIRKFSFYFSKK